MSLGSNRPYCSLDALNSVDLSGSRGGRKFQLAYAFFSFREAAICQMLNDKPTAPVHTYDPRNNLEEAAALRASFEHEAEGNEAEAEAPTTPPPPKSDSDSDSSEYTRSSVTSSPIRVAGTRKRGQAHGQSSSVSINFAPNIAVRMNAGQSFFYLNVGLAKTDRRVRAVTHL